MRRAIERGHARGSTSCAATSPTSTSGAPSTSQSSASSSDERTSDDAPLPATTRASRRSGAPAGRRPDRIRVVQLLATGHQRRRPGARLQPRVAAGPRRATTSRSCRCRTGSAVRKLERPGVAVTRDRRARRRDRDRRPWRRTSTDVRADVIHNHMYRAEIVGTKAAIALGEAGHRRPWVISTVHSSRVRSAEDQDELRRLTPSIDRLIAVSQVDRAQDRRRGPDGAPRSPDLQRGRPRALRPPGAVLHAPRGVRHGADARRSWASSAGSSRRRGTRRCSRPGRWCWTACPSAYLLIVGEGSRLDALARHRPRPGDRAPRRVHRAPRRHPGRDRGLRRRRPAVLPRGPGADDPRGDGAVPPGRRVERGRDPRDDRGRGERAAGPAARPAGAGRRDRRACSRTTRWPT